MGVALSSDVAVQWPRMPQFTRRPTKITFGEMRSGGGPSGVLIYCVDYRCSTSWRCRPTNGRMAAALRHRSRFVCKACGKRGADVRPHFQAARMGTKAKKEAAN